MSGMLDPVIETRMRTMFSQQSFMQTLGATIHELAVGRVVLRCPHAPHILQQNGFIHGGAVATLADTACGMAAFTTMPLEKGVLTVEFKLNLMAPAQGDWLEAEGRVERAGRTLVVTTGTITAVSADVRRPCALVMATMMAVDLRV